MTHAPAIYTVHCPTGMLALGRTVKTFTSVEAFAGYVRALRLLGVSVSFQSPAVAIVFGACA